MGATPAFRVHGSDRAQRPAGGLARRRQAGATLRVTVPEGEVSRLLALTGDDVLPDVVSVPPAAAV